MATKGMDDDGNGKGKEPPRDPAAERKDAADAEARALVVAAWTKAIEACNTLDALSACRTEMANDYRASGGPPKALQNIYLGRKAALEKAAKP